MQLFRRSQDGKHVTFIGKLLGMRRIRSTAKHAGNTVDCVLRKAGFEQRMRRPRCGRVCHGSGERKEKQKSAVGG